MRSNLRLRNLRLVVGTALMISVAMTVDVPAQATPGAGGQTVGVFINEPEAAPGYTLFASLAYPTTYLIDLEGNEINSWTSAYPQGNAAYLRESGTMIRCSDPGGNPVFVAGGDAGLVEEFDWDGNIVWSFLYSNESVRHHHDIAPMPNGNVLILAWELRTAAQAIQAGRNPDQVGDAMWPEHIVEVERVGKDGGNIVWEWHVWDHLVQDLDDTKDNFAVVADHPELVDINFLANSTSDWLHANAIDYNAELDQIMIGIPNFAEFWVIDHSTTTEEAAGHTGGNGGRGGDLLYRWGNPQTYDAGDESDRKLWNQHDPHWNKPGVPGAGNMLVFNNGRGRPGGNYTSIDEIVPPVDESGHYAYDEGEPYGPPAPEWIYTADPPEDFVAVFLSGSQRQGNGNTLICAGPWGDVFEIDAQDEIVWRYLSPVIPSGPMTQGDPIPPMGGTSSANRMFRAERYPPDFPGFEGKDLTPGWPIEIYPCPPDLDNDGTVGFGDLLVLLAAWGDAGGRADLDRNGVVEFGDLLALLTAWGDC